MCDCYYHKCEICLNKIAIHIADFCTPRKNVKVYCPQCVKKFIRSEMIKDSDIVCDKKGKKVARIKGKKVLIICSDPKAYGIELNQVYLGGKNEI